MDALARLAADPDAAGLFLDLDGVLAPIVERPENASVPDSTRNLLDELTERYGLVACVTGRPSAVARAMVGVDGLTYVGEHGLELDARAREWADRIHAFAEGVAWPFSEEKPLSTAFHYRRATDPEAARLALERVAAEALAEGFRTRWGRFVLEVLPPVDANKGTAVRALLDRTGLRHALYAGDDTTDLDGFAALDGLDVAVRVAIVSSEGPSALGERADVRVDSTGAFADLLSQL